MRSHEAIATTLLLGISDLMEPLLGGIQRLGISISTADGKTGTRSDQSVSKGQREPSPYRFMEAEEGNVFPPAELLPRPGQMSSAIPATLIGGQAPAAASWTLGSCAAGS